MVLDFTTSRRTRRGLLAGAEQLHGADDVGLLDRGPAAAPSAVPVTSRWTTVSTPVCAIILRDRGLPDVGPDELGAAQVVRGRHGVHGDHPVHLAGRAGCAGRTGRRADGRRR